jgi:hypothetical protein
MVALLGELSGPASYGTPLNLLFARAGMLLEQNPDRYANIIRGLRLLLAEELRPVEIRSRITSLENDLALLAKSELTPAECMRRLSAFLSPYVEFRGLLGEILP